MSRTNFDTLLEAGCHFGHLKRKWNPSMAPYIFMERNGIHIIDLHKTVAKVDEAADALKQIAKSGKKVLFVATKKQAKQVVAEKAASVNMPYVIERWPGGMLNEELICTAPFSMFLRSLRRVRTFLPFAAFAITYPSLTSSYWRSCVSGPCGYARWSCCAGRARAGRVCDAGRGSSRSRSGA